MTSQGKATSPADRALILASIDAAVRGGTPLRRACLGAAINHNTYYRWQQEASRLTTPQAPVAKGKPGRRKLFDLTQDEVRRLRFWRLVKGSVPLAVESFIAEGLTGSEAGYFEALQLCQQAAANHGRAARPETAQAMRQHWQAAVEARRPVAWPMSVQRACRVTTQEEALFHGKKHASDARGMERRGTMIRTEEGETIPWYAGAIWESDDMSLNDPFRFFDAAQGKEILGRQALFTIDAYSLHWLGASHIGRDRDSYRKEDISSHMREIVSQHGLPLIWRVERGRWENDFIWGVLLGTDAEGKEIRWGGLDAIIHMRDKFTSQGKANVEGSFDLLQAMMDHGFDGSTLSIGRESGDFEYGTRQMLRAGRDDAALKNFWSIEQSAEAVRRAMHLFNSRPKKRYAFGNELRVPANLWAECLKRPCPREHLWRFLPNKMRATVRRGIIEVRIPHYAQSFRFRVHGGARCPNVHLDQGHEVLIAFDPAQAWEGCHVFNADRSARNREGYGFAAFIGIAEHMEDALQEDLHGTSYSPGASRAASQVRREFRSLVSGTPFAGRRVSHAQDSLGNQLQAATTNPTHRMSTTDPEPEPHVPPTIPAPARREGGLESTPAASITTLRRRTSDITSTAAPFDELDLEQEEAALSHR